MTSRASALRLSSETPTIYSCGPAKSGSRESAGCIVSSVGPADPHRQRRLPGVQPGARRGIDEEGGASIRTSMARAPPHARSERSKIQESKLGADIVMAFDECRSRTRVTLGAAHDGRCTRTLRWARARSRPASSPLRARPDRTMSAVTNPGQAQFGIVQGGVYPDLRERSAEGTLAIGFEALRDRRAERRRAGRRDVRHHRTDAPRGCRAIGPAI